MLSDRERAEFDKIASQLEDVRLRAPYGSPTVVALAAAVLVGVAVLIAGVATKMTWLGVAGFVIMWAAATRLLMRRLTVSGVRRPRAAAWRSSWEARWNARRDFR